MKQFFHGLIVGLLVVLAPLLQAGLPGGQVVTTTGTQTITGAKTFSSILTATKAAQGGTAETIAEFGVSDSINRLSVMNGTATNAAFSPTLKGVASTTNFGMQLVAQASQDSGTNPVFRVDARVGASTALANRPVLGIYNNDQLRFLVAANGDLYLGGQNAFIRAASGSPEGSVTAPVGSLYMRMDGGANTSLYVKESGTGSTGWTGK